MKVLFFDTETSHLQPGNICQLSYLMSEGKHITAKNFYFKVDQIDPYAAAVHGLTVPILDRLSGGKRFKDFIQTIYQDFSAADLIVGHNVAFDLKHLKAEFERCQKEFSINNIFCTMKHFTSILKLPSKSGRYKFPKLGELVAYFGWNEEEVKRKTAHLFNVSEKDVSAHDARYDITATWMSYEKGLEQGLIKIKTSPKFIEPISEQIQQVSFTEKFKHLGLKERSKRYEIG